MAIIGSKEFNGILDQYGKGQSWLNDVTVEIEGGENELSPLILLRAYEQKADVDNNIALASQFVLNKHVVFRREGKELLAFTYTGGDLGIKFTSAPYLLDILLRLAYGLMIKKLTPPSEDSGNEERQSTESESN